MRKVAHLLAITSLLLASCGGGGGGGVSGGGSSSSSTTSGGGSSGGSGPIGGLYAAPSAQSLSVADVQKVVAQAAAQAVASGKPATIAVVDRVGNVLTLFRMTGAPALAKIPDSPNGSSLDVQGLQVPAVAAALAKAVTGAYLSSSGNAFSSRTASMIVQQHFPPAPSTAGLESGPLYGVQFSQLPCSDLSQRFGAVGAAALIGPKRSPLGLAADPGGFPLYKNGVVVGGVGVLADGGYGFDPNVLDIDDDADEKIALAGTVGFEAPEAVRAEKISADGTTLRYSDIAYTALTNVSGATWAATTPALGAPVALTGYSAGGVIAGTTYGTEASGIRPVASGSFNYSDAFVLSDGSGTPRYPIRSGTDAPENSAPLAATEVKAVLEQAFAVMANARAQIRRPLDSRAEVTISVVDTRGQVLGQVRSPDAPVFGIDVSLQKARTAAFFSSAYAADDLLADPSADVRHFVADARSFLADPAALTGKVAFSDRANGNLSRPYFPDGQVGTVNGPFSRPIAQFSPFSTGLQSALVLTNLGQHLAFATGANGTDTPQRCTSIRDAVPGQNRLQNGIQIFPGSVPIYRGNQLVGAIGVSGDGIDQDDMISFLGLHRASQALGGIGNAPLAIRADNLTFSVAGGTVRLRYVNCPFAPFLGSADQNVCQGL